MNTSFYEFINQYRAKEAKNLLLSENSSKLTIDALAKEAGFKSKSTFYKVFKQITGNNPSHYSKQENLS
jgi:AraC-like DNA-binding protein